MNKTFKRGDRFYVSDQRLTLIQTEPHEACLVNVPMGNRWSSPVYIANCQCITEAELVEMAGTTLDKITDCDGQPLGVIERSFSYNNLRAMNPVEPRFFASEKDSNQIALVVIGNSLMYNNCGELIPADTSWDDVKTKFYELDNHKLLVK